MKRTKKTVKRRQIDLQKYPMFEISDVHSFDQLTVVEYILYIFNSIIKKFEENDIILKQ